MVDLDGVDLVIFDKDGTLIEFHAMWSGWARDLATGLEAATGLALRGDLYAMLGYDDATGRAVGGGRLAATPMARLRELTGTLLSDHGCTADEVAAALEAAWHAPDPVALVHPVTDLPRLLGTIRESGRRIAVATTDDRDPTVRTLEVLGVTALIDMVVCADDGIAPKPAPDMVLRICEALGIAPARTAVVGDSVPDLMMGTAAGVARRYGVLTGVATRAELATVADAVLESVEDLLEA